MPQIKPTKKSFLGLAALAVVLLFVCCFAYCNQASKLRTLHAQMAEKQDRLANSEQIASRLSVVEQHYLDAQAKLGALEQGVSTKAYVPTLLRQVEELGKSVNLRVVGVRPKPVVDSPQRTAASEGGAKQTAPKKPEPYEKLDIDIEINGKYSDVVQFLYRITSFPKIIAVNSVQMSPVGQPMKIASPVLSVRLSTTAFILKESAARAGDDTKRKAEAGAEEA